MIPPPPPPPGEGPLQEEWLEASSSVPPLPPPPPPPVPPGLLLPEAVETPGVCAPSSSLSVSSMSQLPQPIIPPPPDLQPIVDKLAVYVAKNGPDFESIIIKMTLALISWTRGTHITVITSSRNKKQRDSYSWKRLQKHKKTRKICQECRKVQLVSP
ncbi:splicing factor, suppressor of white-apricot homolog [Acropora muricata]|uniref:splicing factor, suppressor of white-apricot homolog n=1 Tax=Acropora muricata TaxID=159855 RepID=UPI0034E5CB17